MADLKVLHRRKSGFSLIELLSVVVIIGVIAALAVPALRKATRAAENGTTFSALRTIASAQVGYYSQNGRFGRITEINNLGGANIGANSGNDVVRGKFVISMVPASPSNDELKSSYTINAIRNVPSEGVIYQYEITQSGVIRQISPSCAEGFCS